MDHDHSTDKINNTAATKGTVIVSNPFFVNNSVKVQATPITKAIGKITYHAMEDNNNNETKVQILEVINIATQPAIDFVPSINLPFNVGFPIDIPIIAAIASPGPQAIMEVIAIYLYSSPKTPQQTVINIPINVNSVMKLIKTSCFPFSTKSIL